MRSRAGEETSGGGAVLQRCSAPQFILPVVYKLAHSVNKNNTSSPGFNSEDCGLSPLAQRFAASDGI